jgi:Asp/Glu/hydantoin racemase
MKRDTARTLVLVHTVPPLVEVFGQLAAEMLPGVRVLHVLDQPMLERVRQRGALADEDVARLAAHVDEAAAVGADAVLVTCSTISPCVDAVRGRTALPVYKVDEAMIAAAIALAAQRGPRVGVLATNATTLAPTRLLLTTAAAQADMPIAIVDALVEGALPALLAGDAAAHDRLVRDALRALAPQVDVVVLAQASTARVLPGLPPVAPPVLASPQLALQQVQEGFDAAFVPHL